MKVDVFIKKVITKPKKERKKGGQQLKKTTTNFEKRQILINVRLYMKRRGLIKR